MEYVYNMFATPLSWLTANPSHQQQSLDPAFPMEDLCDSFLVNLPWSTQPQQQHQQGLTHDSEGENAVGTDGTKKEKELHPPESYENEISENLNNRQIKFSHYASPSYNRIELQHNDNVQMDDESSTRTEESEQPIYPTLKEVPWTDVKLASKVGPMPPLCTWCHRFEDQPDDKYEEHQMVSEKCFMFGNIVFFRKTKPSWTQCTHCGFGLPKRVMRGTKTTRLKKFFCKLTGKKYNGPQFVRDGYQWYV